MVLLTNQLNNRLSEELATARKLKVRPLRVSDSEFETALNLTNVSEDGSQERDDTPPSSEKD